MVYQKNENGSYSNISNPKKGGIIHAIGEIYIQYPGQSDPNTLFPNMTWQNVSSDYAGAFFRTKNGAFFRAEGGNAQSFNCTTYQPMGTSTVNLSISTGGTNCAGNHTHAASSTMTPYYYTCNTLSNLSYIRYGSTCDCPSVGFPNTDGYPTCKINCNGCCCYLPTNTTVGNATLCSCTQTVNPLQPSSRCHCHAIFICNSGSVETRPMNYTIRIWKRIA